MISKSEESSTYHQREMLKAWNEMYEDKPEPFWANILIRESDPFERFEYYLERFEYHRDELVRLGVIIERNVVLKHIQADSSQERHFYAILYLGRCPRIVDFKDCSTNSDNAMQCRIWFYLEDQRDWNVFIQEHDVPDYNEKFIQVAYLKSEEKYNLN